MSNYAGTISLMPLNEARRDYFRTWIIYGPIMVLVAFGGLHYLPGPAIAFSLFGVMLVLFAMLGMSISLWKARALARKGFKKATVQKNGRFTAIDEHGISHSGYLEYEGEYTYHVWLC